MVKGVAGVHSQVLLHRWLVLPPFVSIQDSEDTARLHGGLAAAALAAVATDRK